MRSDVRYTRIIMPVILLIGLGVFVLFSVYLPRINTGFATEGYVRYHYGNKAIDAQIDDDDLAALKDILVGRPYTDNPSCGFDSDVSIRLTDGRKSIVFCPACDTCPKLRIGDSDRYISISKERKKRLYAILAKYGMVFPCI